MVESLSERIKQRISELPELRKLPVDSNLAVVRGSLDGEEIFLFNEMHGCKGISKVHLEIANFGSGLQILHSLLLPDPHYDLPIFGTDLVVGPAGVSAAIVDLSPVTERLSSSLSYKIEKLFIPTFKNVRELPTWGTIFSPFVKFIRPDSLDEESSFLKLVDDYLRCLLAELYEKTPDSSDSPFTISRYKGQLNYCNHQKRNDKTRRLLEKAFGPKWADLYIEKVLFDVPSIPL